MLVQRPSLLKARPASGAVPPLFFIKRSTAFTFIYAVARTTFFLFYLYSVTFLIWHNV